MLIRSLKLKKSKLLAKINPIKIKRAIVNVIINHGYKKKKNSIRNLQQIRKIKRFLIM